MTQLRLPLALLVGVLAFTLSVSLVPSLFAALPGPLGDRFSQLFVDVGNGTTAIRLVCVSGCGSGGGGGGGTTLTDTPQGRLQVDSTSSISYQRAIGTVITLNVSGTCTDVTIPASGPTLSNAGLSASTLYYVYGFSNAGTLTLEASTTAYTADATCGFKRKTADVSRRLIGMLRTNGSTQFVNSVTQRFLINDANRRTLGLVNALTATASTTSGTYAELDSTARVEFLTWADEAVAVAITGMMLTGSAGNGQVNASIGIDSATAQEAWNNGGGTNLAFPMGASLVKSGLADGYHYATMIGNCDSGGTSCSWTGSATPGARSTITAHIQG